MSVVTTEKEFDAALTALADSNEDLFVDVETNGLDRFGTHQNCGIGVGTMEGKTFYFPFRHKTLDSNLPLECLPNLISVLNSAKRIYAYNLKFDIAFLEKDGLSVEDKVLIDVLVMIRLTEHSNVSKLGLTQSIIRRYGVDAGSYDIDTKAVITKNGWGEDFSLAPPSVLGPYCEKDVYWTWRLYNDCLDDLRSTKQMDIWSLMLDSTKALLEMERPGINVDVGLAQELKSRIETRMEEIQTILFEDAEKEFNINSGPNISKIMNARGLHSPVLTPKCRNGECKHQSLGEPHIESWAEDALVQIDSPFTGLVKQYRTLAKLKNTYLEPYLHDSTIHSTFSNWQAGTGRLSSLDPNLQNIPASVTYISEKKLETPEDFNTVRERVKAVALNKGKIEKLPTLSDATLQAWSYLGGDKMIGDEGECHVRQLITPRPEYKLVSMDYSQMEVRMLLYYLNTPEATALLNKPNVDFHSENAVIAYGIDQEHPDFSFYRQLVKTITFGVLYGMGEKKLAMTLQIARTKAREYKNNFIERMPGFKDFKTNVERSIERTGTVRNKYGRLYRINKDNAYKGINFLIQGTSAEVVTERFIECVKYLKDKQSRLLIQVHDELVFEIHESEYHEVVADLKDIMEQNSLGLTLQVDIEVANPSWAEKVEYDPQGIDEPTTNLLQFIE